MSSFIRGIVEKVESLDLADAQIAGVTHEEESPSEATFRLSNGNTYSLSRDHKHFAHYTDVLKNRFTSDKPVYVQANPETRTVKRILLPRERRIAEIKESEDGDIVRPAASPMLLRLPKDRPAEFRQTLNEAVEDHTSLLLTIDPDTHEILDVQRPFVPDGGGGAPPAFGGILAAFPQTENSVVLTAKEVKKVFRFLASLDIPFEFPDDCCTTRAHEMCRILSENNIRSEKIWNHGSGGDLLHSRIRFFTLNHKDGFVSWGCHVAPLVRVLLPGGKEVGMVLDPTMFNRPVRVEEWVALQHDDTALQKATDSSIFFERFDGTEQEFDASFETTRAGMEFHRADLIDRLVELA